MYLKSLEKMNKAISI